MEKIKMNIKEYYKQLLSEAYQQRARRMAIALPKAEKDVQDKFGTTSFTDLNDMDLIHYKDNENPHEFNTPEWHAYEANFDDEYSDETPAEIRKMDSVLQANIRAQSGLQQRRVQIADKLKASNPDLYRSYIPAAKERALEKHGSYLQSIEGLISDARSRAQLLRDLNAPARLIANADQSIETHQQKYDEAGERLQRDIHRHIGTLHAGTLESINKPQ